MKLSRIYRLVPLLALLSITTSAQQQSTVYFMNLPQNHLLNPALRPTNGFYLGLPAMSGVNFNFNTNFIGFSDVFRVSAAGDSVISVLHPDFDTEGFLEKIKKANYIAPDVNIQTFGLGFSAGKDLYVFVDINEKITSNVTLPGDIFELALAGNEGFVGKTIDMTSLDAGMMYYREIAAGFSKDINQSLRIGVRGKVLMGIASLSVDNRYMGIEVLEDYSHKMMTDLTVNISGPVTVALNADNGIDSVTVDDSRFEDPGFWLNGGNMGFGVDVGAVYRLTNKITLSAAVNGFGIINWDSDITNLTAENEFLFSGFDLSEVIDGTREFEEMAEELLDSLKNSFVVSDESKPFRTVLPGVFTLGVSYNLNRSVSIGFVSSNMLREGKIRSSLMLSANANLGSALSAGISYTAINRSYDNIGAGVAFRMGPFQFYTVADRIPVMYNKLILPSDTGTTGTSLLLPDKWNTLTVRLGMNMVFGNKIKKKSDRPMIVTTETI